MKGAEGFKFIYFHLLSLGISVLCFIVFLISVWNVLVGSLAVVMKLLCRKSCVLDSYCCVGRMTMEFPLSALAIMVLFLLRLDLIEFISLVSGWVLYVEFEVLFCCSVCMRSATT